MAKSKDLHGSVVHKPKKTKKSRGRAKTKTGASTYLPNPGAKPPTPKPGAKPPTPKPPKPPAGQVINPFLRPEDLAALNDFRFGNATTLTAIDKGMADLATQTNYERQSVDKGARQSAAAVSDDAAARGIFQSSIRDAGLYDIEAQRTLQQQFFNDRLNNASLDAGRQKQNIMNATTAFMQNLNNQAVVNAQAASANQQVATPPAPAEAPKPKPPTATPGQAAAAAAKAKKPKASKKPKRPRRPKGHGMKTGTSSWMK